MRMELQNKSIVFRITLTGVCVALYIVLNLLTFKIGNIIEISFTMLPVIFIAIVYGPIEGMIVGALGEFVNQLNWELSVMTPVWMLAPIMCGLVVGLLFRHKNPLQNVVLWIVTIIAAQIAITGSNTLAMYINNIVYPVWPIEIVWWVILIRAGISLGFAAIYGVLIPLIFKPLEKLNKYVQKEEKKEDH